eukprot:3200606-Rhodomonas_salina.1
MREALDACCIDGKLQVAKRSSPQPWGGKVLNPSLVVLVVVAPSRVVIIEFAWSYTVEEDEMITAGAAKRNQYAHLTRYLRDRYLEHVVSCQSYIISVLSLYPQSKWVEN